VKVVDEMRKLNVAPDTGLFTALISGYANIGNVLSAFQVFKNVKVRLDWGTWRHS
jgi:pentatricopeptide repeat protein